MPTKRELQIEAFMKRGAVPRVQHVKVLPRDDEIRKGLAHPEGWIGFPDSGAAEWPLDDFTMRRIRDGSVGVEGEAPFGTPRNADEAHKAHADYLAQLYRERAPVEQGYVIESAEHPGEIAHRVEVDKFGTEKAAPTVAAPEWAKGRPPAATRPAPAQPRVTPPLRRTVTAPPTTPTTPSE